ncbi:MAG: DJ-1/PfpI family protein [Coriobacteriia bacterium]|nr:DJ-1/PfpI family protein [Coriobacteriia bacterium]MBS5477090.1 DJ-1/PfpI family protein [Coriobacteriia bacterium]
MPNVAVLLADGFETSEALTVVDVLRRAGIRTRTVSVMGTRQVISAQQVQVAADESLESCSFDDVDCIVLPGGLPAARRLASDARVADLLQQFVEHGTVASSDAGSSVLDALGLLEGRLVAAYTGSDTSRGTATFSDAGVVADGNLITSRNMANMLVFALGIVSKLAGEAAARKLWLSIGFSPDETAPDEAAAL